MKLRSILLETVLEAVMGTREYIPPQCDGTDPNKAMTLMGDFYLLDLLQQGSRNFPSAHGDTVNAELSDVEMKLLPYLRKHLLLDAGHAIVTEAVRLIDCYRWGRRSIATTNQAHEDEDMTVELKMKQNVLKKLVAAGFSQQCLAFLAKYAAPDCTEESPTDPRMTAPYAQECAKLCAPFFAAPKKWDENFGGPPWAAACEVWNDLYQANSLVTIRMAADRVYQLQHNTGALLNKVPEYNGDWVKTLLNIKYKANNPEELMRYASPFMKQLAGHVLGNKYGRGWDANKHGNLSDPPLQPQDYFEQVAEAIKAIPGIYLERFTGSIHITYHGRDVGFIALKPGKGKSIVIRFIVEGPDGNKQYGSDIPIDDPKFIVKVVKLVQKRCTQI